MSESYCKISTGCKRVGSYTEKRNCLYSLNLFESFTQHAYCLIQSIEIFDLIKRNIFGSKIVFPVTNINLLHVCPKTNVKF